MNTPRPPHLQVLADNDKQDARHLEPVDRCETCRFWMVASVNRGPGTPPGGMAICRRFPPTVVVIPVQIAPTPDMVAARRVDPRTHQFPQHVMPQPVPLRPFTAARDWCGEFLK